MQKNKETAVIILAGGKSSRAEVSKGLRKIDGDYWLDLQISHFLSLGFKHIFVGLGYDHEKYINSSVFLKRPTMHLKYIINNAPHNGSFSTLKQVLIRATKINWKNTLIIHVDHALPGDSIITALANQNHFDVVKPCNNGISGHPVKISKSFCLKLINKPDSSQLNREIRKLDIKQICWLEMNNDTIHFNLNTEQDWKQYVDKYLS